MEALDVRLSYWQINAQIAKNKLVTKINWQNITENIADSICDLMFENRVMKTEEFETLNGQEIFHLPLQRPHRHSVQKTDISENRKEASNAHSNYGLEDLEQSTRLTTV